MFFIYQKVIQMLTQNIINMLFAGSFLLLGLVRSGTISRSLALLLAIAHGALLVYLLLK